MRKYIKNNCLVMNFYFFKKKKIEKRIDES